ncbi:YaaC family protein [Streptomyces sp. NPDC002611]
MHSHEERHHTFVDALKSMERLFRQAEEQPPAARPLPLLHGLCQAARAIASCAPGLADDGWRLTSNGIRSTAPLPDDLADVALVTEPPGSAGGFARVSEILGSPVWGDTPLRLEEAWDALPVNLDHPLTDRRRRTPLYVHGDVGDGSPHAILTVVVCDIPDHVVRAGTREALDEHLGFFPPAATCHGYGCHVRDGALVPALSPFPHGRGGIRMNWVMPQGETGRSARLDRLRSMTTEYAGNRYFMPVIPSLRAELHPLMAWWAVLCGLGSLMHDRPDDWRAHLGSEGTVRAAESVSHLLREAPRELPHLIAEALEQAAATTSSHDQDRSSRPKSGPHHPAM